MNAKEHLAYLQGWHAALSGKPVAAAKSDAEEYAAWNHGFEDARSRRDCGRLSGRLFARIQATAG